MHLLNTEPDPRTGRSHIASPRPEPNRMSNTKYLPIITGMFVAALLISNTLDTKIFMLGSLALPAGQPS